VIAMVWVLGVRVTAKNTKVEHKDLKTEP
jgi:hypothetical protein